MAQGPEAIPSEWRELYDNLYFRRGIIHVREGTPFDYENTNYEYERGRLFAICYPEWTAYDAIHNPGGTEWRYVRAYAERWFT